jgi:hypothetical protein
VVKKREERIDGRLNQVLADVTVEEGRLMRTMEEVEDREYDKMMRYGVFFSDF